MLQPKIERSFSDEEGSSDYLFDLSDNDSDTSDMRFALGAFLKSLSWYVKQLKVKGVIFLGLNTVQRNSNLCVCVCL